MGFAAPAQISKNKRKSANSTDSQDAEMIIAPRHIPRSAKNTKNREEKDANTTIVVFTTKRFAQRPGKDGIAILQNAPSYTMEQTA